MLDLNQTSNRPKIIGLYSLIGLYAFSVSAIQSTIITLEQRFVETDFDVIVLLCAGEMQPEHCFDVTLAWLCTDNQSWFNTTGAEWLNDILIIFPGSQNKFEIIFP